MISNRTFKAVRSAPRVSSNSTYRFASTAFPVADSSDKTKFKDIGNGQRNVSDARFYEKYNFSKDFLSSGASFEKDIKKLDGLYSVPEGGFVRINSSILDKYLPEGLPSEVEDSFEFTSNYDNENLKSSEKIWMVREASKLLFRFIDENDSQNDKKSREIMHKRTVHVPKLTDKDEWSQNVLKITHYGKDLVNFEKRKLQGAVNYIDIHKQNDCVVDKCIESIKSSGSKLPNKLMLLGDRGAGKSMILAQAVLFARLKGWVVVNIPRGWEQVCEGNYVEPVGILRDGIAELGVREGGDGAGDSSLDDLDTAGKSNQTGKSADYSANPHLLAHQSLIAVDPITSPATDNPLTDLYGSYTRADAGFVDGKRARGNVNSNTGRLRHQSPLPTHDIHAAPVYDNVFQSAAALRGLFRAHGAELRQMPLKYCVENASGTSVSRLNQLEKLREKFLVALEKVLAAPSQSKLNFMQLKEIIEGEDHFAEQDSLDSDILMGYKCAGANKAGFDMRSFKFNTLEDLLVFGLAMRGQCAGVVFSLLIEELRRVTSHKIMIVVDQYNTFEAPSPYFWNHRRIYGKDLSVPRAVYGISKRRQETDAFTIANGVFLCATSHTHEEARYDTFQDSLRSIPLAVRVPQFNQVEFFSTMRLFDQCRKLCDYVSINQLLLYRSLCSSNPLELRKNCFLYFTALGLDNLIDPVSFEYISETPEQQEVAMKYEQKFAEFKANFKGLDR